MEYKSMGKMIQRLRKANSMTQRDLAEQLNVTDKAVSKWERDIARPDIGILPKLAATLNTTVASLIGEQEESEKTAKLEKEDGLLTIMQQTEEMPGIDADFNPAWEQYRARSVTLFRQGIAGFLIGSIGLLIVFIITMLNTGSFNVWEIPELLLFAIVCGLFFAGVPYGWRTISERTSQWVIYGNFLVILLLFMLKIIATLAIAMVGYPIALIYNLIRSQKSKKNVRLSFAIWILVSITYIVFAIMMALPQ